MNFPFKLSPSSFFLSMKKMAGEYENEEAWCLYKNISNVSNLKLNFFCSENEKQKKISINSESMRNLLMFSFSVAVNERCVNRMFFFSFSHNASNVCVWNQKNNLFPSSIHSARQHFFLWHTSAMIFSCSCNNRQTSEKQIKKNLKFKI